MIASRARVLAVAAALCGCSGVIADPGAGGDGAGSGPGGAADACDPCAGESQLLRLTRVEYERTVRAVLGEAAAEGVRFDHLPSDGTNGPFASNAFFAVDEDGVEGYRAVAEEIGENAALDAASLLACDEAAPTRACIEGFVQRIGSRLLRRPLDGVQVAAYADLFETAGAASAADGVRLTITAMLQSPFFLYRVERGVPTEEDGIVALTGHEIASRLSFFLWKSGPDDALLAAADAGRLSTADEVRAQARRMLADPRADFAIARFHSEWLGITDVATHPVNETAFPEFAAVAGDMRGETEALALHVFREGDARLATLLTAPYTFGTPALASLYGAPPPSATGRIEPSPTERSGVLTHASFLTAHVNDPSTAAVHRGRTIRESFLCQELPLPPPVDTIIAPDPSLSTRQKLEAKTSPPSCAACHRLMNPLGFAFGHYDAIGRWRTMDGPHPIDATGEVLESDIGEPFDGAVALSHLLAESEQVHRCIARQWMRFALGRHEDAEDERSLAEAYEAYDASGRDLRELIVAITGTDAFRHRAVP